MTAVIDTTTLTHFGAYQSNVACTNCDFTGLILIVKKKRISETPCPNCACEKLERIPNT